MRIFINLFILAYLLDGNLSVIDELLQHWGIGVLSGIRNDVAYAVLIGAVLVYLFIGIDSRIPKKIVLPPIIYLLAISLFPLPVPAGMERETLSFLLALMQLLVVTGVMATMKYGKTGHWLLPGPVFEGKFFRFNNTGIYLLANVFLALLILPVGMYFLLTTSIQEGTAGFLRLDTQGIYLTEKEYVKENQTIRLVGMIHMGKDTFYKDVGNSLSSKDAIILAEGVSDRENLMRDFSGAGKAAEFLGLASQNTMRIKGKFIDEDTFENSDHADEDTAFPKIVRADIDSSELSPRTRVYLNNIGRYIKNNSSLLKGVSAFYRWSRDNISPEEEKAIFNELIDKRNRVLFDYIKTAVAQYNYIIIPWGAMHMPQIEKEVIKKGFVFKEAHERRAIDFWPRK